MQTVTPEKIAAVMALVPAPHSFAELEGMVRTGLPKSALRTSVAHVGRTADERRTILNSIIAEATYKRRDARLTPGESERAERLARVFATAQYVWDDEALAREFLHAAHPLLESRTPLDVSMSELGARRVEALLWQLFYGLPV
ncbi:putative toxin-antitoxin system antitoxin component (TIGR02293 family) [Actimicrobium sp. GrIS 1.19]|uniref:antitoxin Xre/MbcA/ParS toxin-binding domain-containing protein n=1 Tax=Actimicrobium sp. GrIS 1.19 TaxID=3071708 RepID=UPI002DFC229B|nr:putative toxin-antitoxin system antitoxin component (TIGR02293 family) [Actimicrobium sp. GrIS 1.19]